MAKTEYFYKKYCKICSKLTDSWKISEQYFNFLKRSPGMKYPEDTPGVVTYDWVCESCAPDYYRDPNWIAPEPFKKVPLPIPKGVTIKPPAPPVSSTLSAPPARPAPPAAKSEQLRPPVPPRMAAPIPTPRVPPVATPPVSAKPSTPEKQDKIAPTPAVPRFKVPKLNK